MNKHTTARKGKRIHVVLKSGRVFVAKLIETKSRFYVFEEEGKVLRDDIRSFSINQQPSLTHHRKENQPS